MQEILDQVADVDLVLNLKCTGKQLVDRKLQGGVNLLLQESQIKSYSEVDWKEKLRTYAEQVFFILLFLLIKCHVLSTIIQLSLLCTSRISAVRSNSNDL